MHPILIKIGPLTLYTFGLFVATGFAFAYRIFLKRSARLGITPSEASSLMILLLLSGIFGARAYYVIWRWNEEFARNWGEIIMIRHGGLVFFGGFLAASLALVLWARSKKMGLPALTDALAPSLVVGHFWGRIGCLMNGCCYGRSCEYPWGIHLPAVSSVPIHPTQIYEALGLLEIYAALWVIEKVSRYPGQLATSYLMLYSILRFVVEFYRGDVPRELWGKWTLAQGISVLIFIAAWLISAAMSYQQARRRIQERRAALEAELENSRRDNP